MAAVSGEGEAGLLHPSTVVATSQVDYYSGIETIRSIQHERQ